MHSYACVHLLPLATFSGAESINVDLPLKNALFLSHSAPRETSSIQYFQGTKIVGPLCLIKPNLQKFSLLFTSHKETGQRLKMTTDIKVEIKPMLVSGVRGPCAPIGHTGLRRASDDAYSLWEVVQFRAPNCAVCAAVCPPLPSLLAGCVKYRGWQVSQRGGA